MSEVTPYFLALVAIYALGSLQFGYHIGELNSPQEVISCQTEESPLQNVSAAFVNCIKMTDIQYGFVVALFPVGGLIGSLSAGRLADKYGRKTLSLVNCLPFAIGPLFMSTANSIVQLGFGRILCGIGSGTALVLVPIYLSEISPVAIRGATGVMTQLSCVIGILISQIAGVYLSTVPQWRYILALGGAIACLQFVMLLFTSESPKWLASQPGQFAQAKKLLIKVRGRSDIESEMRSWHIQDEDEEEDQQSLLVNAGPAPSESLIGRHPIKAFFKNKTQHPAIRAVLITQLASQFTGINAVIFYSTSILRSLFPGYSAWISVGISVVNLIVTLIAARLVDQAGRRPLLLISLGGMMVSSFLLAMGLNLNLPILSGISTMCIVASFGLGMGPLPFLLISEYFEVENVGIAQSVGLAVNWIATFTIGFVFPIMKQHIEGSSFYVFASFAVIFLCLVWRYVPESRNKTAQEIWHRS